MSTYTTKGNIGYGTTLQYFQSGTWHTILEMFETAPPAPVGQAPDFSHYQSPADANNNPFDEKKPGWFNGQKVTFRANLRDDQMVTISGLRGLILNWMVTLPFTASDSTAGGGSAFSGFVVEGPRAAVPNKEKMTHEFVIEVTGVPTYFVGS